VIGGDALLIMIKVVIDYIWGWWTRKGMLIMGSFWLWILIMKMSWWSRKIWEMGQWNMWRKGNVGWVLKLRRGLWEITVTCSWRLFTDILMGSSVRWTRRPSVILRVEIGNMLIWNKNMGNRRLNKMIGGWHWMVVAGEEFGPIFTFQAMIQNDEFRINCVS
jgi:hypothetical protein